MVHCAGLKDFCSNCSSYPLQPVNYCPKSFHSESSSHWLLHCGVINHTTEHDGILAPARQTVLTAVGDCFLYWTAVCKTSFMSNVNVVPSQHSSHGRQIVQKRPNDLWVTLCIRIIARQLTSLKWISSVRHLPDGAQPASPINSYKHNNPFNRVLAYNRTHRPAAGWEVSATWRTRPDNHLH